jgi:antitoxin MazE6
VKTAVSLPEKLFREAEATAKKLRVPRSKLYAMAIAQFLERAQSGNVTAKLDEVYSENRATLDPILHAAQLETLDKDRW